MSAAAPEHTAAPWPLGEWDEHLGYDCMTSGIRVGPVMLDGADYGQKPGGPIAEDAKRRMLADARLISSAPDLLTELKRAFEREHNSFEPDNQSAAYYRMQALLAKAIGRPA